VARKQFSVDSSSLACKCKCKSVQVHIMSCKTSTLLNMVLHELGKTYNIFGGQPAQSFNKNLVMGQSKWAIARKKRRFEMHEN